MSKLVEMLDKTQTASASLGFAASRQGAANPSVVLLGRVTAAELMSSPELAQSAADAVLVTLDASDGASVAAIGDALKGRLWGARVGSISAADAQVLKEGGCDFIVFDAEDTEAAILNDEELGTVLAYDPDNPDFSEDTAKAVRTLHIDCAMITSAEGLLPLTVQKLLGIQVSRALVGRRCILTAPAELGAAELLTLRNAGIVGLAVSLAAADVERMKQQIADLPQRRVRSGGSRGTARAPAAGFVRDDTPNDDDYYDPDDGV